MLIPKANFNQDGLRPGVFENIPDFMIKTKQNVRVEKIKMTAKTIDTINDQLQATKIVNNSFLIQLQKIDRESEEKSYFGACLHQNKFKILESQFAEAAVTCFSEKQRKLVAEKKRYLQKQQKKLDSTQNLIKGSKLFKNKQRRFLNNLKPLKKKNKLIKQNTHKN